MLTVAKGVQFYLSFLVENIFSCSKFSLVINALMIFLSCRPCNCDKEGSISGNCDATGQCQCKENVVGKQCNQCAANHFDLDIENPKGCKACFCYGHGISCTSAEGIGLKEIASTFDTDHDGWRLEDVNGK